MNIKSIITVIIIIVVTLGLYVWLGNIKNKGTENNLVDTTKQENNMNRPHIIIKTNKGEIEIELLGDKAPNTVTNFTKLAGVGFYNGTKFHRVIKGFMIQGGDLLSRDDSKKQLWGTGGPGYSFADELTGQEKYPQGTLAMANSGPNTNGSQFFIVTASPEAPLPPSYTVFGKVVRGMDIALAIENVKTSPNDQPVEDVVMESTTVK
ncbi:MAG: peptidylprolyl isomerase [Patescibacteria group bacterium]